MADIKKPIVSIVTDPFKMKTLEINEAQNSNEELDLDSDLAMERITDAIEEQTQKDSGDIETLATDDPEARLAREIAEDQALESAQAQEDDGSEQKDAELAAALPAVDASGELDKQELLSCLEALLFMHDKPLSVNRLRDLLGPDFAPSVFQEGLAALQARYQGVEHGIELVEIAGGYQFRTKPGRAALARKLAKTQTQRLSSGAMETLAITAYKQPVMKEDVDKIRGVDSSYFIRGLLDKKLIKITGRSELPGRPMLYATTQEFLEVFGLKDLAALPSLHEIERLIPASEVSAEEDPKVKELRRLVGEMSTDKSTLLNYNPGEDEKLLQEIKERISSIPTSTPYLDEQKELEKQAAFAATHPSLLALPEGEGALPGTLGETPAISPAEASAQESGDGPTGVGPGTPAETPSPAVPAPLPEGPAGNA